MTSKKIEAITKAALEAAEAATDAHGEGNEPDAWLAYDFITELWHGAEEPKIVYLPEEMPALFRAAYEAALKG
jgi:hypothetical protein